MTIPARGHKAYRDWDTVMTYNYHPFISCLVISLITSAWKKTAGALTVSETTNNLHNIINFLNKTDSARVNQQFLTTISVIKNFIDA